MVCERASLYGLPALRCLGASVANLALIIDQRPNGNYGHGYALVFKLTIRSLLTRMLISVCEGMIPCGDHLPEAGHTGPL